MGYIGESHYELYEEHCTHNKVGEDGAVALAEALRVNKSLKELHLCKNNITDRRFKCLTEALLKNTALDQDTREKIEKGGTLSCMYTHARYTLL